MPKGDAGKALEIDPAAQALVADMLTTLTTAGAGPLAFPGHVPTSEHRWPPALLDVLAARIQAYAEARHAGLPGWEAMRDEASAIVQRWHDTYPVDVFPPLEQREIDLLTADYPHAMSRIAAYMARHVTKHMLDDIASLPAPDAGQEARSIPWEQYTADMAKVKQEAWERQERALSDLRAEFANAPVPAPAAAHSAEMTEVRWVRQEDAHGCAVACLAMVTGKTYAEVKAWFLERMPPEYDFSARGLTYYPQDDFLTEHGYVTMRKSAAAYHVRRETGWPPQPFGPVHLCSVSNPGGSHMVVLLADGRVFDPLTPEPTTLGAWGADKVNYVHAVYPLVAPPAPREGEPALRLDSTRIGEIPPQPPGKVVHLEREPALREAERRVVEAAETMTRGVQHVLDTTAEGWHIGHFPLGLGPYIATVVKRVKALRRAAAPPSETTG